MSSPWIRLVRAQSTACPGPPSSTCWSAVTTAIYRVFAKCDCFPAPHGGHCARVNRENSHTMHFIMVNWEHNYIHIPNTCKMFSITGDKIDSVNRENNHTLHFHITKNYLNGNYAGGDGDDVKSINWENNHIPHFSITDKCEGFPLQGNNHTLRFPITKKCDCFLLQGRGDSISRESSHTLRWTMLYPATAAQKEVLADLGYKYHAQLFPGIREPLTALLIAGATHVCCVSCHLRCPYFAVVDTHTHRV